MLTLKKLLILIFITISVKFYGQVVNNEPTKSIVTFSLFTSTISYAPRWNVGYIKKISDRYWVGIDLGYGNKNTTINFAKSSNWINDNYQLFEIRPEIYYDLNLKSKLKHLISAELFYINHKDNFKNSWFLDTNENVYYKYDSADYSRIKYGLNLNYNILFNLSGKLALMQKVGIGFKHRNVTYTNIVNKVEDQFHEATESFIPVNNNAFIKDSGIESGLNFNLELKLIYKF